MGSSPIRIRVAAQIRAVVEIESVRLAFVVKFEIRSIKVLTAALNV
jgi:hypothetical protein